MTTLRSAFATNPEMEKQGIVLDYGDAGWFRIARAGGANDRFSKIVNDKMKPYRRQIEQDMLPAKVAVRLTNEAVAESIVLAWGHPSFATEKNKTGEGKMPWEEDDGTEVVLDFNVENVVKVLNALPDLSQDIQQQAMKAGNFRASNLEDDAKN